MSKKRKTRQQKIASSQRPQQVFSPVATAAPASSVSYSLPVNFKVPAQKSAQPVTVHDYSYVAHDMRKTLIIITLLVILNTVIYFLMRNNIVHIIF